MIKKGIILAGGSGTRLYPTTLAVSKQLLPVYDKPMIYYPLSILMLAGIKDIFIITTPEDNMHFRNLLKDGSQWGIKITYAIQDQPEGIPQAYTIAEGFLSGEGSAMILGDNILYGANISQPLQKACNLEQGATIFTYQTTEPERFGIIDFDKNNNPLSIEEKPTSPKSNHAITGLYFFDGRAPEIARKLKPSERGETEIIDMIQYYLDHDCLNVSPLGRGHLWLDAGTHSSMLEASQFISMVERHQRYKIGCPEEISWRRGWISSEELHAMATGPLAKSGYGNYLENLIK